MTLRSKLILAFLALAVVPLAGIVLYSYLSSLAALRQAALWETTQLADDMGQRMAGVRDEVGRGIARVGELQLASFDEGGELEREMLVERITTAMGDAAPFVESLEFIPGARPPRPAESASPVGGAVAPAPPAPPSARPALGPGEEAGEGRPSAGEAEELAGLSPPAEALVIFLRGFEAALPDDAAEAERSRLASGLAAIDRGVRRGIEEAYRSIEAGEINIQVGDGDGDGDGAAEVESAEARAALAKVRQLVGGERHWALALADAIEAQAAGAEPSPSPAPTAQAAARPVAPAERRVLERSRLGDVARARLERSRELNRQLIGREFAYPVESAGQEVGQLRAQLASERVLQAILTHTRREQGEIPFALDPEGTLYVADEADRARLAGLDLDGGGGAAPKMDDWVVVRMDDPESGVVFGIARPLTDSLAEIRRIAGRNFAWGLGLVALAVVGIAPLSGRLTRSVGELTEGAERLAEGDLEARVQVRSKDELGRLAGTFNRMAGELAENQRRLLEEERLRKEEEIARSLLAAENERKSRELEEARRFQLSLLPAELPAHPELALAVRMRTATEVGGDYYDFHVAEDGALTAVIGDATGHGARAGTMVTVIKSLFTAHAAEGRTAGLAAFLARSNRAIKAMGLGRMAMALAVVEVRGDELTVASAGMPPLLIHRGAVGAVEEVAAPGVPLGAMADAVYEERRLALSPGDTLLLMSDGLPELQDPAGDPLGYRAAREAFAAAAGGSPEEIIDALFRQAEEWRGDRVPSDDVTFVVLRRG